MVSAIFTKENNFCYFGWPPFQNGVYSLESLLQEKQILSYKSSPPSWKGKHQTDKSFSPWKCIPFTSMERSLFLKGKDIKLWESKFFPSRAASFRKQSQLMGKPIIWCESCLWKQWKYSRTSCLEKIRDSFHPLSFVLTEKQSKNWIEIEFIY